MDSSSDTTSACDHSLIKDIKTRCCSSQSGRTNNSECSRHFRFVFRRHESDANRQRHASKNKKRYWKFQGAQKNTRCQPKYSTRSEKSCLSNLISWHSWANTFRCPHVRNSSWLSEGWSSVLCANFSSKVTHVIKAQQNQHPEPFLALATAVSNSVLHVPVSQTMNK